MTDGKIKIVDRKKNIFKLSQGEYVAAEKLENINLKSPFIMQNFVYGDSFNDCLVSIVVADPDYVPQWAKQNGVSGSLPELCASPKPIDAGGRPDADLQAQAQAVPGEVPGKDRRLVQG